MRGFFFAPFIINLPITSSCKWIILGVNPVFFLGRAMFIFFAMIGKGKYILHIRYAHNVYNLLAQCFGYMKYIVYYCTHKRNAMKIYALIQDWDSFREVEAMLISNSVPFTISHLNDGFAFVFYSKEVFRFKP